MSNSDQRTIRYESENIGKVKKDFKNIAKRELNKD